MKRTTSGNGGRAFLVAIALGIAASVPPVAQANTSADTRTTCNAQADADGLSGYERRLAVTRCVRQNGSNGSNTPILAKVTECNKRAGNMSGDARTSFMDSCLKNN